MILINFQKKQSAKMINYNNKNKNNKKLNKTIKIAQIYLQIVL